jgi:hypothetical protein
VISAPKVSSCVDCATPIIGDRLRCPACHDQHADELLSGEVVGNDDATISRDRPASLSTWQSLAAWLVVVLIVVATALGLALTGKSCQ